MSSFKKRAIDAVRLIASSNAYVNRSFNQMLGHTGSRAYLDVVRQSEAGDPVLDITDLTQLRASVDKNGTELRYPNRIESVNRIYGIKSAILGEIADQPHTPTIEHGLFIGDYIYPADTVHSSPPAILTFGSYRRDVIHRRQDVPVFTVGPYVHYAKPHLDDERLSDLKKQLGRTLLVFPSHTNEDSRIDASLSERYGWIAEAARGFDTVLVNVFWWDLLSSDVAYLQAQGFRIVSCGVTHDRNFLRRQKSLFRLADQSIGDGIGTHVGYSIGEGVPYKLVATTTEVAIDMTTRPWMQGERPSHSRARILKELTLALTESSDDLSKQKSGIVALWGIGQEKTATELGKILQISTEISVRSGGWSRHFGATARTLLEEYADTDSVAFCLLHEALRAVR